MDSKTMENKENNHPETKQTFDHAYTQNRQMYGHPYQELQDFFKRYPHKGAVLDLGCGQGRDSLFLASIGYKVTAVDRSHVGITQMMEHAKQAKLDITGITSDISSLELNSTFDIILFDMILHVFEDKQQQEILKKFSTLLNKQAIICIVFPDDMNQEQFLEKLTTTSKHCQLIEEIKINDVPKMNNEDADYTFTMIVVKCTEK